MSKIKTVFNNLLYDPGTMFAAGNLVLASAVAGTEGIIVSAAALALTTGLQLYKAVSGKAGFNTLYLTAGANFITAASAFYNTAMLDGDMIKGTASALAFLGWGGAHIFLARRDANNGQHGKFFTNPFIYAFAGNMASLQVNGLRVLPSLLVLAAAGKSLIKPDDPEKDVNGLAGLFNKHMTPIKFTTLAFIAGGIQSYLAKDYSYMCSQLIWGWAALNLDKGYNENLVSDTKSVLKLEQT